jgi:ZIP family zinc transporter
MEQFILILIIVIAGPLIGSLVGVLKRPSDLFLFNMLAFAAGVMIAVSFLELIPESIGLSSIQIASAGILAGSLVMYAVDRLIPHLHPELCQQEQGCNLKRTALYLLLGIFIHNFPEGMAIAAGSTSSLSLSLVIAIAIAVHDIPEGICTSAPYYFCTKKRLKSFLLSSSTAIPTLIGFFLAYFLFQNIPAYLIGFITAATAGLMIYISADELIPVSSRQNNGFSHSTIFSLIIGILFVIVLGSLVSV